jgi:hypothetical protein
VDEAGELFENYEPANLVLENAAAEQDVWREERGARKAHKRLSLRFKVTNTSLDHLLLGTAADGVIIELHSSLGKSAACEFHWRDVFLVAIPGFEPGSAP